MSTPRASFVEAMHALYVQPAQWNEADDLVAQGNIRAACEAFVDGVCEVRVIKEPHYHNHEGCHATLLKEVFDD